MIPGNVTNVVTMCVGLFMGGMKHIQNRNKKNLQP